MVFGIRFSFTFLSVRHLRSDLEDWFADTSHFPQVYFGSYRASQTPLSPLFCVCIQFLMTCLHSPLRHLRSGLKECLAHSVSSFHEVKFALYTYSYTHTNSYTYTYASYAYTCFLYLYLSGITNYMLPLPFDVIFGHGYVNSFCGDSVYFFIFNFFILLFRAIFFFALPGIRVLML